MSVYSLYTIDSAPDPSKPALEGLNKAFGFVPNLAAAMAESPVLLNAFAGVFQRIHSGTFTEAQIQTLLLTNAVTNASPWPVAFHSALALQEGVNPDDVRAIRERRAPSAPKLAVLSALARAMIEKRGQVDETDVASFREAGFSRAQVLEVITVIGVSAMTNYAAWITNPVLEARFKTHAWAAERTERR